MSQTGSVGKFQLQIGSTELTSGMASSDFAPDGALGTSSTRLNPFVVPGVMYGMASATQLGSGVIVDNIIASCEDSANAATSSYKRTFVGDAGNYYTLTGSTVTLNSTDTYNTGTPYIAALTDMVSFNGNTYTTIYGGSGGDITQWTPHTSTLSTHWWSTLTSAYLNSNVPHPMLVYSGILYIADGYKIHGVNSSGTVDTFFPALPFTLNSNEIVYAMGIDPMTGLMMISVQTLLDIAGGVSSQYVIYLWDGVSAQYYRKIYVDDLCTAFLNVEGAVYVASGVTLGQWNGNGVTFLRKFKNVQQTSGTLVYKQHMAKSRNILHILDGAQVLSYGTVLAGMKKSFFYTANTATGNPSNCLFPTGDYGLAVADTSGGLYTWDYTAATTGAASIYGNYTYFPRSVFIRKARIITTGIAHSGSTDITLTINNESGTAIPLATTSSQITVPTGTTYVQDFDFGGGSGFANKVMGIQPVVSISNNNYGVIRIIIYYDIAN